MAINCPICNQHDAVQRVSALVSAGKSSGAISGPTGGLTYSDNKWGSFGTYTRLRRSDTSELASLLDAPRPPMKVPIYDWRGFLLIPFAAGAFAVAAFLALCGLLTLATQSGSDTVGPNPVGFLLSTGILISGLLCVLAGAFGGISFLRRRQNNAILAEERFARARERWRRAMERWEQAYYCHRDGVIFDPESGETVLPRRMSAFLYETD